MVRTHDGKDGSMIDWWEWVGRAASVASLAAIVGKVRRRRLETASRPVEQGTLRRRRWTFAWSFKFEAEEIREPDRGLGGELTDQAPEEDARAGRPWVRGAGGLRRKEGVRPAAR